jgi:hypothetical protein
VTSIKFYKSMEDINTVRWKMNELANACKTLGQGDFAAILKAMSDDLDDVVDSLTAEREAETPRRDHCILSPILLKGIEDDERARG